MSPLPGDSESFLCITDETAEVAFGGVEEVRLSRSALRIRFRSGVGFLFGLPDDAEIGLDVPAADYEALERGLIEVVARCRDAPALEVSPV